MVKRNEFKFLVLRNDIFAISKILELFLIKDKNCKNGPYKLTSIYFDNFTDDDLFEKIQGINYREKYRVRFYNNDFENGKFEIKRKNINVIEKIEFPINKYIFDKIMNCEFKSLCIPQEFQYVFEKMTYEYYRPKSIVIYERLAFYFPMDNIRVTIDMDIRGASNAIISTLEPERSWINFMPKNIDVVEIKFDGQMPNYIQHILSNFRLQRASVSKYVLSRIFNNFSMQEDTGVLPF